MKWDPYDINDHAKGVFLSDRFKNEKEQLSKEIRNSEENIFRKKDIQEITTDKWLFAISLSGSISAPISTIEMKIDESIDSKISFENGFLYKIPYNDNEANNEPTFIFTINTEERKNIYDVKDRAKTLSDILLASLSFGIGSDGELYSIAHSFRPLTYQEYQDFKDSSLNFERINRAQPLKETGHVVHAVTDEPDYNFELFKDTFSVLDEELSQKRRGKIETSYSMMHDGMKARTKEQGYLTFYTALNYLIEDVGRQSRTAKSEAQMVLKMADKDIISTKTGIEWIEVLKQIHNVRSDVLWKADTISNDEIELIKEFTREFLSLYFDYLCCDVDD